MKSKNAFFSSVLVILTLLFIHGSAGAVIYVSGGGAYLQTAINGAPPPNVIEVTDSSTYSQITMKSGVNVTRTAGQTPTINCILNLTSTVTFTGPISCNIDGFNITHTSNTGAGINLDGTLGTVSTVTISNCNINTIYEGAGIVMNDADEASGTVDGCTIQDCEIYSIALSSSTAGAGIRMNHTVSNCTITNTPIHNCRDAGIRMIGTINTCTIQTDSDIYSCGEAGIRMDGTISNCTVQNNDIYNCREAGIRMVGTVSNSTIDNNTFYNDNGAGIRMGGDIDCTISNNDISDCSEAGIRMNGKVVCTISNNTINDCKEAGIASGWPEDEASYVSDGSSITIIGNTIGDSVNDNGEAGIYIKGTDSGTVSVFIGGPDNDTERNTIHYNGEVGIRLERIDNLTVDNNIIHYNGETGLLLRDVGTSPENNAVVKNNTIDLSGEWGGSGGGGGGGGRGGPGINIGGLSYLTIGPNNTLDDNNEAGIAFYMDRVKRNDDDNYPLDASSGPVTITGNEILSNENAGIGIREAITGTVTITGQNNIHLNNYAGIGVLYNCTMVIDNNNIYSNSYGGIGIQNNCSLDITNNNIYLNGYGGIGVRSNCSLDIINNNIYSNSYGGIGIITDCTLLIEKNTIRDNVRGGIHTGNTESDLTNGGFDGTNGNAVLTIRQNKIYDNGASDYGGGIDVRHASGTIYNNLVYDQRRGGIRFGDWITEIVNNTVAHNGSVDSLGYDRGGGINYDDIGQDDVVNAPPEGSLADSLNDPLIRNNIVAYNLTTGIRVGYMPTGVTACPGNSDYDAYSKYRDYNLLYSNNGTTYDCRWYAAYPDRKCVKKNYGGCGFECEDWLTNPDCWNKINPNDIMGDPLFVSITEGSEDYHLQAGSPAVDAGSDGNDMGAYGGSNPMP